MDFAWMAWTQPTAIFFIIIALLIAAMGVWEWVSPGGAPRTGILGFETTRGDRLFVSLLGSGFICLASLGLVSTNLWWGLALALAFAVLVFIFV